jgi:hypothetical protein
MKICVQWPGLHAGRLSCRFLRSWFIAILSCGKPQAVLR